MHHVPLHDATAGVWWTVGPILYTEAILIDI